MADIAFLAGGADNVQRTALIPSVNLSIDHTMSNTLSSYPIEKTPNGTYNAVVKNNVIAIRGAFSRIHLQDTSTDVSAVEDIIAGSIQSGYDRPEAAFTLLKEARDNNTYMDVVTGFVVYDDCLIQSFTVHEDKDTGGLMSFELTMVQPRFTEVVNAVSANVVEERQDDTAGVTKGTTANAVKKEANWCGEGATCQSIITLGESTFGSATGEVTP
jgi:hypothetical protein